MESIYRSSTFNRSTSKIGFGDNDIRPATKQLTLGGMLHSLTSTLAEIPWNFFQSREDIRQWGVEHLTDPSMQPLPEIRPANFPALVPGYATPRDVSDRKENFTKIYPVLGGKDVFNNEILENPNFMHAQLLHTLIRGDHPNAITTYNYLDQSAYEMDHLPYTRAKMIPTNGKKLHARGNPYVAYPYGVPRVEKDYENSVSPNCLSWAVC